MEKSGGMYLAWVLPGAATAEFGTVPRGVGGETLPRPVVAARSPAGSVDAKATDVSISESCSLTVQRRGLKGSSGAGAVVHGVQAPPVGGLACTPCTGRDQQSTL